MFASPDDYIREPLQLAYWARLLRLGPVGRPEEQRDGMRFWIAGTRYIVACGKVSESPQDWSYIAYPSDQKTMPTRLVSLSLVLPQSADALFQESAHKRPRSPVD